MQINRRQVMFGGCGLAFSQVGLSAPAGRQRRLRFQHAHTHEELDVVYFDGVDYVAEALPKIEHVLRDFRTGETHPVDPKLLDLLAALFARVDEYGAFEIISAFRSGKTNTMLRKNTHGVAERSFHMVGQAIDVRLTSMPTADLHQAALALEAGGVGYYPRSNFLHLDTGPVRNW